jgi:PAS domain S-box-containing protein
MRVLIVEDDAAARALLAATARDRHHEVTAHADAEAVWASLAAGAEPGAFDLAVVDIGLPGQDGIAFCRQFRRHAAGRHAIVLLVTADERAETLEAALEAGAHDYVIKPIERRRFAVRLAIAEQRSLAGAASRYSREALRESERRFEAFMANSPTLAFIKDADGRFLYVNRRFLEIVGVAEGDVIGYTAHHLYDHGIAEALQAHDGEVLRSGPRELIEMVPLADGPHRFLTYKFPLSDSGGRPTLVAGIAIDITDRLRAEEALRAQTARAEALLEVASQVASQRDLHAVLQGICDIARQALRADFAGVVNSDPDTLVLRVEAMAGGTQELRDAIERLAGEGGARPAGAEGLVVIEDVAQSPNAVRALAAYDVRSIAFVRMVRDGRFLGAMGVGSLAATRTFSPDEMALLQGIADHAAIAVRNARLIEERRRTEEQARNAQKLESLGVLAGGIAHDFNNLLVGVLGNAGLALLELPADSPARQPIRDIEVSAQRAAELTRQMLAYSGRGRFRVEPVDLSSVAEEMSQLLGRVISKQARLSLRLGRQLPAVVADVTQLRQVVMNLITNASDALGDQPGTVTLETGVVDADRARLAATYLNEDLPPGRYVYLEVSDTGCGMDAPTTARIFEPFFTTKFTGRGLGLAAVLGIVRGHKGAIAVQSAPGRGTTFRVYLPASADAADVQAAATGGALGQGAGLVLLVDDEEAVRGLARRVLERGGYRVVEAASGDAALAALADHDGAVRAIVLDLTMPGLTGETTLQEIRRRHPAVPVIVSSGYIPEDEGALGGAPFLAKPYRPSELVDAVKAAIEGPRQA